MWLIRDFLALLIYFLPSLVAWKWKGSKSRLGTVFIVNLTLGWTVIGWLVAWAMVCSDLVKLIAERAAQRTGAPSTGYQNFGAIAAPTDAGRRTCAACAGSRTQSCPQCSGSRGTWINPTTQHGTSQWQGCSYCMQSGAVTCRSCGGTGYASY